MKFIFVPVLMCMMTWINAVIFGIGHPVKLIRFKFSPKAILFTAMLLLMATYSQAVTKTWVPKIDGHWTNPNNWSPFGLPSTNDDVIINDNLFGDIDNVPTITLSSLSVSGNCRLIGSRTITLGGNAGTDFTIASGATLTLDGNKASISITLAKNATASINGTLNISSGCIFNTSGTNVVTTVTGSIINRGTVTCTTATNLLFQSGSTYNHAEDGGAIPIATWDPASTCLITGFITTFLTKNKQTFFQTFGNFTWNCPGQSANLDLAGELHAIMGNFTISSTNGFHLQLGTGSAGMLNVGGSFIMTDGTLSINSLVNTFTMNVAGDFSQTAGAITAISPGIGAIVFNGGKIQTFTSGGTITSAVNFTVNSGTILQMADAGTTITGGGSFTLSLGATLGVTSANGITTGTTASGNIQVSGKRTYSAGANYIYNGTGAQVTGNGLTQNIPADLIIHNNAGVTLSAATTLSDALVLTNGILITTGNNLLSITNTATDAISGGSAASFINGPVKWSLPASLVSGSTYNYPVGAGITYLPFALVNPTTTGTTTAQVQAFATGSGGTADGTTLSSVSTSEYWQLTSSGNFTNSSVSVSRPSSSIFPLNTIGGSATLTGAYSDQGGTPDNYGVSNSNVIGSNMYFTFAKGTGSSFWYKADAGTSTTTDGAGVTRWDDQSGSNNATPQSTATTGITVPTYQSTGSNFNPSIHYPISGNGYFATKTNAIFNDMTFFAVYNSTQTTGSSGSLWSDPAIIGGETASTNNGYKLGANGGGLFFKGTAGNTIGLQSSTVDNDGIPRIVAVTRQKSSSGILNLYVNGALIATAPSDNASLTDPKQLGIGNDYTPSTDAQFVGNISEVYGSNSILSATVLQSFASYLALKYGITLAQDYTSGCGTTIYSVVSSAYGNNIAGLGNDITYGLNQKVSTSITFASLTTTSSQIVMATNNDFSSSNLASTRTSLTNGQYLIWGDNNGITSTWTTLGSYSIVNRIWQIQNTNSVGAVYFQIDLTDYPSAVPGNYALMVATNSAFSSGVTIYPLTKTSGNLYTTTTNVSFPAGTSCFTICYQAGVYVRQSPNGSDANNGTSWTNALATIDKAITTSSAISPTLSVFVASGSYTPSTTSVLQSNIKLYGGFAGTLGTEIMSPSDLVTKLNARNLKAYASILTNSSAPVVSYSGSVTGALLDGFTITGATSGSGAYAVNFPAGADSIQNCKILINTGITGGLSLNTSNVATNVLIADNSGIGINFAGTSGKVINATIANNTGVGINCSDASNSVTNSILWGNSDNVSGTVPNITYTASAAPLAYASSTTYPPAHNSWWNNAGNIELYQRSPNFKNPNNSYKPNRNYELLLISPCLGKGLISANTLAFDANGKPRTYSGTIDMGAFEKWDGVTVSGSTVSNVRQGTNYTGGLYNIGFNDTLEIYVTPSTNFNMLGSTINAQWLELGQDTIGTAQLTNGTITADSVLYVRRFSKTLSGTNGTWGVWTFFGLPFGTAPLSTLDGATDENSVRIETYDEPTRAKYGTYAIPTNAWRAGRLSTTSTIKAGTGYALSFNSKVPQNDIGQTVIFSSPASVTFMETTTSTANVTLGKTSSTTSGSPYWYDCGWNLIANPLPQSAGINATWNSSSSNYYGAAYFYKPYTDSYDVQPVTVLNTGTGYAIAPNAAFFVQTDVDAATATFTAGAGTGTCLVNMDFVRPVLSSNATDATTVSAATIQPAMFQFKVAGGGDYCNTFVVFDPGAHADMEPMEDNITMVGVTAHPALQLSTTATGSSTSLVINRLPFTGSSMQVPMQIYIPTSGCYTITMPLSDTIAKTVLLQDSTGALHNLTMGGYTFTTTTDGVTNHYTLIFSGTSTAMLVVQGVTIIQDQRNVIITCVSPMQQVALYGETGQTCYVQNPSNDQVTLQLPPSPGVYLLKVITAEGVITKKLVNK